MMPDASDVPARVLAPHQSCEVWIFNAATGQSRLVFATSEILLEAPNWAAGGSLILNGEGGLWRLALDGTALERISLQGIPDLNNDHVLDPDGDHAFVSANDWNIYRVPLAGGAATLVTSAPEVPEVMHFLHGVSPDGRRLAFIGLRPEGENWWARADVFTMTASGEDYRQLTSGPGAADGCEYSADGEWIYFNSEQFDGHAQIARMRADGTDVEQLTFDDRVNWFPHVSASGRAVYLSYPPDTEGHPADLPVELRLVDLDEWTEPVTVARIEGGQGSINVNSWSPEGDSFAFVAYPFAPRRRDDGEAVQSNG